MNPFTIAFIAFGVVVGLLVGALLAIVKTYNKQLIELHKLLMAKSLTDYAVNTPIEKKKEDKKEETTDIIPAEQMTDAEFDHIIKEQVDGK
jgi:hypothetical protein